MNNIRRPSPHRPAPGSAVPGNNPFVGALGPGEQFFIHLVPTPSGDPFMNVTDEFFAKDAWAREAGIELVEVSPGRATVRMAIAERHKNSHGTVHGGALFTLADTAFALASNSHGVPAAAINAHISYVTAARGGTLYARAEESSLNPTIATYSVTVTDDVGTRIALFQGMVYRKTPKR